jgi:Tfp pilus assembly protein PilV
MERSSARETGFTIVEVVVAASILFFVLTALFGLTAVSESMSVRAKERSVLTNAIALHIDRIRAIDFDQLVVSTSPTATVQPVETETYEGMQVVFSNSMSEMLDDRGRVKVKQLTVRATLTGKEGRTYRQTMVAAIRNPKNDTTAGTISDPDIPRVSFGAQTPPSDDVLYSTSRSDGTPAALDALVESPNDRIVSVQFKVAGQLCRNGGSTADWTYSPGQSSVVPMFPAWDTGTVGDGFQTVTIVARDDQNRIASADRRFIVDNSVPQSPVGPVVASSTLATTTILNWGAAPDGNQAYAARYTYVVRRDVIGATNLSSWEATTYGPFQPGTSIASAVSNKGPIMRAHTTTPFSRYWVDVWGEAPRSGQSTGYASTAVPFVSRPYAAGTSTLVRTGKPGQTVANYAVTLEVSKPTFSVSGLTIDIQAFDWSSGAWVPWASVTQIQTPVVSAPTDTGSTYAVTATGGILVGNASPKQMWYRAALTFTPAGYSPGPAQTLYSNAVGQNQITYTSAYPMPGPDWSK